MKEPRDYVFIVDDNFIGNKKKLKAEVLPAINQWMSAKEHPFTFFTEASINLADDAELMELMSMAGFDRLFIAIEKPDGPHDSISPGTHRRPVRRMEIIHIPNIVYRFSISHPVWPSG